MIVHSGEYRKKNGQRGYVMMNNFIFENKTKVYFGKGGVKEYLGGLLANFGETVMLAYGGGSIKCNGVYDEIMGILNAQGKCVVEFSGIMSNPTYQKVQEGAKLARENHVDLILAVGGGSVSDCCKVISAQANLDEDIWEMLYAKHTLPTKFIPLGTIVTVFGTGSEMNNGAVITNEEKKIKGALWGAQAEFAFLDPAYSLSVPMQQVISGAFDTLSHAMETYFGKPDENNLSDDINEAVMRSVIHNIRILLTDPENYDARSEAGVGVRHGRERRAEDRQGHGFSGASDPASARRLHRLQPRCRAGGDPSRSVPPHLQVWCGAVCTVCAECLGHCAQGQRRGDRCCWYRRAGRVH